MLKAGPEGGRPQPGWSSWRRRSVHSGIASCLHRQHTATLAMFGRFRQRRAAEYIDALAQKG
jgi:hypothetical protein